MKKPPPKPVHKPVKTPPINPTKRLKWAIEGHRDVVQAYIDAAERAKKFRAWDEVHEHLRNAGYHRRTLEALESEVKRFSGVVKHAPTPPPQR